MDRPNPKDVLEKVKKEEKSKRGQLKVFFGYAAGVGKTYSMLESAHNIQRSGIDVVVGYIEPHTRTETLALLDGLEILPTKEVSYKSIKLKEFDLDLALKRNPQVILVDELAHTNASGCRHNKRWKDVEELLLAGIDVYTTVNVQHLESLNDIIEIVTNIEVRETVPDTIFDISTQIELIDVEPDVLLERFNEGKIYKEQQAKRACENFFTKDNLIALREIALRKTAERVNKEVQISRLSKQDINVLPTSDTLLACISSSPSSQKIIRTASRIAESLFAKWIVLYVENIKNDNLSDESQKQLKQNLELAKNLGAEIVILHGENKIEQIIRFSKLRNITKIIIGRNHYKHKVGLRLFKKDIVDKLIDEAENIDIHIIPYRNKQAKNYKDKKENSLNYELKVSTKDLVKLVIITLLTTITSYILRYYGLRDDNILLVYTLGVLLVSVWANGYSVGVISSIINIVILNYLFTNPLYTLSIDDPNYIITLLVFCVVGIITSTLTSRIKYQMEKYSKREQNTQMLYQISRNFIRLSSKEDIVNKAIEILSIALSKDIVCYIENKNTKAFNLYEKTLIKESINPLITEDEKAVASWVFNNKTLAGNSTDTLPGAKGFYIPIIGIKDTLGVIGVSCDKKCLDNEDLSLIESVIAQMAIALDREELSEIQKQASLEIESERLRSNLLRAISHDLRTPLAGISGAVSTIIKNKDLIDESVIDDLLNGIYEDSQWLIRLVENLLSMTRIEEGKLEVKKQDELVEEVIEQSLKHIKRRIENVVVNVNLPDEILFVPMDAKLIEQVFINLIDNAIKYTKVNCKIEINVYNKESYVCFEVKDNGPGIKEEFTEKIFDRFFTGETKYKDSRKGIGLGLSICKSIIDAHKGEISVRNNKDKGSTFKFTLPKN